MENRTQFLRIAEERSAKIASLLESQNIIVIVGQNSTGKTLLLNVLYRKAKNEYLKFKCGSSYGDVRYEAIFKTAKVAIELGKVLVIDNVELYLDVEKQQRVLEELKGQFPELKVICTTHSALVCEEQNPINISTL